MSDVKDDWFVGLRNFIIMSLIFLAFFIIWSASPYFYQRNEAGILERVVCNNYGNQNNNIYVNQSGTVQIYNIGLDDCRVFVNHIGENVTFTVTATNWVVRYSFGA